MGLSLDRLLFDPAAADLADNANVGAFIRAGSDGELIDSTSNALHVLLQNSTLAVTATDLDIRDLSHLQDSVKIGDGVDFLAINADGSLNVTATFVGTYAEDSAVVSGDKVFGAGVQRHDANTSTVSADGDYSLMHVNSLGGLKTSVMGANGNDLLVNADGSINVLADLSVVSSFEKAEDSAAANADILAAIAVVRQDALSSSVSADGDYGWAKMDAVGALWTSPVGQSADAAADAGMKPVKVGGKVYTGASALAAITAGNSSNLGMDLYRRVWVNDAPSVAALQQIVTVGTSAVALPTAALAGRKRIVIQNVANAPIYVGSATVTTSGATQGIKVGTGDTLELPCGQAVPLYAISNGASKDVAVLELG